MLYKKNNEKAFDMELFKNPTSEYRGAPFWAWNDSLDEKELFRQIEIFKEMGLGGFHMHSRTGMNREYLSDGFMELVKSCTEKAKEENMISWLYDEDRWPSGAAGGIVTKEVKYRARYLLFDFNDRDGVCETKEEFYEKMNNNEFVKGYFVSKYEVILEDGYMTAYKKIKRDEESKQGFLVYAFVMIADNDPWFNNQAYLDTLNKKAIEKFIEVTHERYYEYLKEYIGDCVHAIFTDEPQFKRKESLGFSHERKPVRMPYTDDFNETFFKTYGYNIEDHLPKLLFDQNTVSKERYDYHDHIAMRFAEAFADTIGDWCEKHGLYLTGHMMEEPTLLSQTSALGDAMRSLRAFQIPGIDMLCDRREYSTAKQCQSIVHQYGREGMLSELYGVTNWDFDFRGHKMQGDWQACLGVTVRVHHLTWVSMNGEAKRDYPASIGYQSPWYKEYAYIEDYFARINTVMTRGRAVVRVGVIHPVESYWLRFGPLSQSDKKRRQLENDFSNCINWLLFNQIDFDFISESLLSELTVEDSLSIGEMDYDIILVPPMDTIRQTTLDYLYRFIEGNRVVVDTNREIDYVNASPSLISLSDRGAKNIEFKEYDVVKALEAVREVIVTNELGQVRDDLIYQLREDGKERYLFIANGKEYRYLINGKSQVYEEKIYVTLYGEYDVTILNPLDGSSYRTFAETGNGKTIFTYNMPIDGSLLVKLKKGKTSKEPIAEIEEVSIIEEIDIDGSACVSLEEENVLLLDLATYMIEGEDKTKIEKDILVIDNEIREYFGYKRRGNRIAQPWVTCVDENDSNLVSLFFEINLKVDTELSLALESLKDTNIYLDGMFIKKDVIGYYTDKCIEKICLSEVKEGTHILRLDVSYNEKTNLEWCYILGDFDVEHLGRKSTIVKKKRNIGFSSITDNGMPFYGGNFTYHFDFEVEIKDKYFIEIDRFFGPLIKVLVDGIDVGNIAFSPYRLLLREIEVGKHSVQVIVYGNRFNSFGQLHLSDRRFIWFGPDSYRSKGNSYALEHQLKENGLVAAPRIYRAKY